MTIDLNQVHGFRGIAEVMLQPSVDASSGRVGSGLGKISLRELRDRHRFADGERRTLGEVARRWRASEGSTALHVLAFNTFLLNVKINVFKELDKILPAKDFFETVSGALLGGIVGGPAGVLGGAIVGLEASAARELLQRASGSLADVALRKPDVETRGSEVGNMVVDEGFDVAALVEVWAPAEQNAVLNGVRARGIEPALARGALPGKSYSGSGLLTLGLGRQLGEAIFRPYAHAGSANQDTDYYAEKGALLVRVPVGGGTIDLYSTHLYYGNDIPDTPVTEKPTDDERVGWRTLQLRELQAFINETHKPENVAVLVGDFNIDEFGGAHLGGSPSLAETTDALALEDQWLRQFRSAPAHGGTDCALGGSSTDCVASSATATDAQPRIDYLFVERPTAAHTFNVDVTRMRLRDFARSQYRENQASLSDHRGLDFHLLCSPK